MILELVDKLLDRMLQLVSYKKEKQAILLESYVQPVFAEFERVHSAYLESFSRYRDMIRTMKSPNWIGELRAIIEKDNLFSADSRTKVMRLAESRDGDRFEPFVQSIADYLLGMRLVDPLGREIYPGHTQRWRQGLSRTLNEISQSRWQMVLDPNGARPPLSPQQIRNELAQLRKVYSAEIKATSKEEALNRACSLWALDSVVGQMQAQYDRVCKAFAELKDSLVD